MLCDVIAVSQHSAAASTRLPFSLFCFCCHRAVRGRTPRDRISLYVYLSALLDGTGLEKRTRKESVNEGTKSVLELPKLFLTSYLCELVVINEKNCIHTFSCLLGTFVQLM